MPGATDREPSSCRSAPLGTSPAPASTWPSCSRERSAGWVVAEELDGEVSGSVKALLMTMVHHRAVDVVRREASLRRRSDEMVVRIREETEDPTEAVVEAVAAPGERDAVRKALRSLPDDQREVLELMYFGGL